MKSGLKENFSRLRGSYEQTSYCYISNHYTILQFFQKSSCKHHEREKPWLKVFVNSKENIPGNLRHEKSNDFWFGEKWEQWNGAGGVWEKITDAKRGGNGRTWEWFVKNPVIWKHYMVSLGRFLISKMRSRICLL